MHDVIDGNEGLRSALDEAEHEFAGLREDLERADRELRARDDEILRLRAEVARLTEARRDDAIERVIADLEMDRGATFWGREPHQPPPGYYDSFADPLPVLMIGNLKGGVGKTTLAVNLAAHYRTRGERVLLIDLDYQGSATAMSVSEDRTGFAGDGAYALFRGETPRVLPFLENTTSGVIDCYYPFANLETTLMLRWLAGRSARDVRYLLADFVQGDFVRSRFDRVILDTAPRISTAFVNALCAATFLVIPTNLDQLSAETVQSFLPLKNDLATLRTRARSTNGVRTDAAFLNYMIVGNRRAYDTGRTGAGEKQAVATIREVILRDGGTEASFPIDALIPNKADFLRAAGWRPAYDDSIAIRDIIARVARKIDSLARAGRSARR